MALTTLLLVAQVAFPAPEGAGPRFGESLAADGDVLVVACGIGTHIRRVRTADVYFYERFEDAWSDPSPLRPELGGSGVLFSTPVAVEGNRIAIGLPLDPSYRRTSEGSNHVFERSSVRSSAIVLRRTKSDWIPGSRLEAPRAAAEFGGALDLEGDTLVVAAPFETAKDAEWGAVHVFKDRGDTWCEEARFVPGSRMSMGLGGEFGAAVALSGNRVIIGAPEIGLTIHGGPVTIYARTGGGEWLPDGLLEPQALLDSRGRLSGFGRAVDIQGDVAVVGAPWTRCGGPRAGVVFVYEHRGETWRLEQTVHALQGPDLRSFGSIVLLRDDLLLVAARAGFSTGEPKAGAVYGFRHGGRTWLPAGPPLVGDPGRQAEFGASLALAGDELFVGAPGTENGRGVVFAYSISAHFPALPDEARPR